MTTAENPGPNDSERLLFLHELFFCPGGLWTRLNICSTNSKTRSCGSTVIFSVSWSGTCLSLDRCLFLHINFPGQDVQISGRGLHRALTCRSNCGNSPGQRWSASQTELEFKFKGSTDGEGQWCGHCTCLAVNEKMKLWIYHLQSMFLTPPVVVTERPGPQIQVYEFSPQGSWVLLRDEVRSWFIGRSSE